MAREKEYNKRGTSKPDPGVAETVARVAEQQAARAKRATPEPVKPDAHYQAILDRVQAQVDQGQKQNAARDAATKASKTSTPAGS